MSIENEPVYTGSIVSGVATGTGFFVIQEPLTDLLLEFGTSERLAKALVSLAMFIMPVLISIATAWWTRRQTVTVTKANNLIEAAFDTPAGSPPAVLEKLKVEEGS